MRAVIQRVKRAEVIVGGSLFSSIGRGLLVLLGIGVSDDKSDARYLAEKIVNLRIFDDDRGRLNLSVKEVGGEIMAVSQFTLYGDTRKGRRPSFVEASPPASARELYEYTVSLLKESGLMVKEGKFQEMMEVGLINDGPVTIIIDSRDKDKLYGKRD